jgi:hypothetical protein
MRIFKLYACRFGVASNTSIREYANRIGQPVDGSSDLAATSGQGSWRLRKSRQSAGRSFPDLIHRNIDHLSNVSLLPMRFVRSLMTVTRPASSM